MRFQEATGTGQTGQAEPRAGRPALGCQGRVPCPAPQGGRRRSPQAWCPNKRCPSHMVCSQQKRRKTAVFWTAVKHQLSGHLTVWYWRCCSSYMTSLQCIYCISVCSCFFYFSHTSKPCFPSQNTVGVELHPEKLCIENLKWVNVNAITILIFVNYPRSLSYFKGWSGGKIKIFFSPHSFSYRWLSIIKQWS